MIEIKLIEKDSDISDLNLTGWDVEIEGRPQDVYHIVGFVHTVGGHWGENAYWCCDAGETPTYENLIQFDGHVIQWGIEYVPSNYTKHKWNQTRVRKQGEVVIKRNGKPLYSFGCCDVGYGISKGHAILVELQEHAIDFASRKFKEELVNSRVWYNDQPAIIDRVSECSSGISVYIVPDQDEIEKFKFPTFGNDEDRVWIEDIEDGTRADIMDSSIKWYRR